ncbi:MAG: hypothetical protein ACYS47_15385, partial [Planctomycetota bacterium]
MNAITYGGILFQHSLRRPGLFGTASVGAAVLLSLSAVTAFGLGRELLMVREAAFGTLYLFAFIGALVAAHGVWGQESRNWAREALARPLGKTTLAIALTIHPLLVSLWVALFLTPFLVASLALSHKGLGFVALVSIMAGLLSTPLSSVLRRTNVRPALARWAPPLGAAALAVCLVPALPGAGDVLSALLFSLAPIALTALIPGAMNVLLPGPGGSILSLGLFALANMREALSSPPWLGWAASLLPDLGRMNPSFVVSRDVPPGASEVAGVFAYVILFGLGVSLVVMGAATLKES